MLSRIEVFYFFFVSDHLPQSIGDMATSVLLNGDIVGNDDIVGNSDNNFVTPLS